MANAGPGLPERGYEVKKVNETCQTGFYAQVGSETKKDAGREMQLRMDRTRLSTSPKSKKGG